LFYTATACLGLAVLLLACAPALTPVSGRPAGTELPIPRTPADETGAPVPARSTPALPADSPLPTPAAGRETRLTPTAARLPERVPVATPQPAIGEVPAEVLNPIIADLAGRLGIGQDQIEIVRAESVIWNDGSLGCPEPGMRYTQAQVDGYWVVLGHDGQTFDYRATAGGFFRLCENPGPLPPSTPGGSGTG
jgi:hypothetical protein